MKQRFSIRLNIRHPSADPRKFSKALKLETSHSWMKGEVRKTPAGRQLPGAHKETMWNHVFKFTERHDFLAQVQIVAKSLTRKRDYILQIQQEGGVVAIYVHLPGDANIGDVVGPDFFDDLMKLNVQFGIEVFPRFND